MILFKENLLQSAMFFKAEILDNFKSETKLSYWKMQRDCTHARRREHGNLLPWHFEEKSWYYSEIKEFKTICQKLVFDIEKIRWKWLPISINSCMKHLYLDSYNPFSKWIVQTFLLPKLGSPTKLIFLHVWRMG